MGEYNAPTSIQITDDLKLPDSPLPTQFDVLVVGGGAAGLYAALCLPPQFRVGLITKDALSLSASDWAQGGIAAAIAPDDSPQFHLEDTLKAGVGLCEPEAVKLLVERAPSCVRSLVEMGVAFDRKGADLALTLEAAHSHHRVLHAADTTGRAVITTLTAQVLARENIQVFSQAFALDLWMQGSQCRGASIVYQNKFVWLQAKAVVLATGGGGQVFAQTTNPELSTGDGVAMAWRSGAELRDLEFVQFHPTALTKPGAPRFLISEAVRGEGAHLIDAEGQRFAFDYHSDGELAPRDVVSRAIFSHLQKTAVDPASANVWLDLRPIPADKIRHRFPNIIQVCQKWGIDVFQEPIPVAPAAHYWMGGITTNALSQTTIPQLYAVGENASTGVHGANRLASNSLLECLVYGAQLSLLTLPEQMPLQEVPPATQTDVFQHQWEADQTAIMTWRQTLPRLVWQSAGICREQRSLDEAIAQIEDWRKDFAMLSLSQSLLNLTQGQAVDVGDTAVSRYARVWGETRNLLDIAYLILRSSAFRTESRGGHYRADYPETNSDWQVHTLVNHHQWLKSKPVGH
ncbi:L-aspartate oxidase [Oscillatoria sp. FACHB-1407]|uniref:L-aspartate oxidase n=1 Tax=Oscillatoria sp. FACHB-1407 TaxID=2692847 RepID=UPI00168A2EEA|nr:L-aspartate oxidase [Oscillatoria sp. FACHB-1407]MBD2462113.1 L-aspartate oxidase [Oscillatoria sp. FACHB-1407]